ncbi:MAG: hypothetical protein WEB52_02245 [Dehalococcoidia bacterium]
MTEIVAAQRELSRSGACVLVINSRESSASIASIVSLLRRTASDLCIICLRDGRHPPGDTPIDANICLHEPYEPDYLADVVQMVRAQH